MRPRNLCLLLALSGCAEAAFSVHAPDNDLRALKEALSRAKPEAEGPKNGSGHGMVYVFAGPERRGDAGERTLYGYDLEAQQVAFAVPADVRSRIAVGRGILAHREGDGALVVRDARTGKVRAQATLPAGDFLGLSADDERVYYVVQGKAGARRSTVTALSFDGQTAWSVPAPGTVGAPAAHGGLLALPYRYQELVLLDGRTGTELSRVRQKDEEINFVRGTREGIFYGVGSKGVAQLNERSVRGVKGELSYFAPNLGDRVRVFLHWDGYRQEQADFSAFDRNRLLWSPAVSAQGLGFRDDLAVLHSYRFLFAADARDGKIRWAYAQPRQNIMAADDTGAAVGFVTQDGTVGAVSRKDGARLFGQKLELRPGQQVLGAQFDAAGFAPQGKADAPDVLAVLHDIIFDKDSSFIAVKTFAVQAVNSLQGKEATAELLRVVTAEAMPSQVTRAAGEALVARKDRDVAAMLVAALEARYDFLEGRQPRGVGVLAQAAAAMGIKEAVPALTRHLFDPVTGAGALRDVVGALIKIRDPGAVRSLRELLLLYRTDPLFAKDAEALKLAGEGLLKLGGEPERRLISYVVLEPRTLPPLAGHFSKLLDETAAQRSKSSKPKAAAESPEATGSAK
jgi:hypothetical protein